MAEVNYAKIFNQQMGPMHSAFEFMETQQIFLMQQANKQCYQKLVPRFRPTWPMSRCEFVLVKGRK